MIISKAFGSQDSVNDILLALQENSLVIFTDTKTGFEKFYQEKLIPVLPEGSMQGYTNHPTEAFFYFIYDGKVYTREQAISIILKFRTIKNPALPFHE